MCDCMYTYVCTVLQATHTNISSLILGSPYLHWVDNGNIVVQCVYILAVRWYRYKSLCEVYSCIDNKWHLSNVHRKMVIENVRSSEVHCVYIPPGSSSFCAYVILLGCALRTQQIITTYHFSIVSKSSQTCLHRVDHCVTMRPIIK